MTAEVGVRVAGTVSGGGEPAGGPGCKSLSKVLLAFPRGQLPSDSPGTAPTPPEVVAAAPPPAAPAAAETPARRCSLTPWTLGLPSLSGHDRRLHRRPCPRRLWRRSWSRSARLGSQRRAGRHLYLRPPVPGCGEDEPGTPTPARPRPGPPARVAKQGAPGGGGAPPGLGSDSGPRRAGVREGRPRGRGGGREPGRRGGPGLAGAGDRARGSAPPAPALLVLIHSASCRWKSRSCRFARLLSASGLPGSAVSVPWSQGRRLRLQTEKAAAEAPTRA